MIWLEFVKEGFDYSYSATEKRTVLTCPKSKEHLLERLRFAVASRRVYESPDPRPWDHGRLGTGRPKPGDHVYHCVVCDDPVSHDKVGTCVLCGTGKCRGDYTPLCGLCAMAREKDIQEFGRTVEEWEKRLAEKQPEPASAGEKKETFKLTSSPG